MSNFFSDYFNFKCMLEQERKYKQMMARRLRCQRITALSSRKSRLICGSSAAGAEYDDMLNVQADLLDLFEESAGSGQACA